MVTDLVLMTNNVRRLAGAVILKIAYGYTVDTTKPDPLVILTDEVIQLGGQALQPGKWLIDFFPPGKSMVVRKWLVHD